MYCHETFIIYINISIGNFSTFFYKAGVITYIYTGRGDATAVTESDGRTTRHEYDGMGCAMRMEYPHGWGRRDDSFVLTLPSS